MRIVTMPALWEREHALAAMSTGVRSAAEGRGAAVFLVGEAGLGKTTLLDVARAAAGSDVGVAYGDAMETAVAFGLFGQLSRSLGDGDVLGDSDPVVEPSAPYHRALRWLERRGDGPLLLALDDLHWADADSLALIGFLVRRLHYLPVTLIATLRPWPAQAHELAAGLAATGAARLEQLAPLSSQSVLEVLTERMGSPVSSSVASRAHRLCNGNPLLVEQVADGLARGEHVPDVDAGAADLAAHLLLSRFAGLNAAGLRFARAGSVLGTSFRSEIAVAIAELEDDAVESAFEGLHRSGLTVEATDQFTRFAHPLFAQALYEDLAPPVRRRLHARAFALLSRRGLDAEAAEHAVRADLVGDAKAIAALVRTGRSALVAGAVATGARQLEAAVRLSADRAPPDLLLSLCEALAATGRIDEAGKVCDKLLSSDDTDWRQRVEGLRVQGRIRYLAGAPDFGGGALAQAIEIAIVHDPARAVQPLLDQSLGAWLGGGPRAALPLAARALEMAADADDVLRRQAEATWGHLAQEGGDPAGLMMTDRLVREVGELDVSAMDPVELAWPWASVYQLAMNDNAAGRYAEAERVFKLARETLERAGAANALATLAIYIANLVIRRGKLEEALSEAVRAVEFAELTPGVVGYADIMRAEALLWLGRLDESEHACERAEASGADHWFSRQWIAHVRGLRLLWEGDDRASDELLIAEEMTLANGVGDPNHVQWAGHAIAAHVAAGRVDDAERVVSWLEDCADTL
jgi:tetratricopeptide (TPR) repeat protein